MGYNPDLDCVHNAYGALLDIRNEGKDGRVIFVYNPPPAYLFVAGRLLNKGITFGDNNYPDYSPMVINRMIEDGEAEDITDSLDHAYMSEGEQLYQVGNKGYPLSNRFK